METKTSNDKPTHIHTYTRSHSIDAMDERENERKQRSLIDSIESVQHYGVARHKYKYTHEDTVRAGVRESKDF